MRQTNSLNGTAPLPFWTTFVSMSAGERRPIAWKGTLAQYVGRLHRQHYSKRDVAVADYVENSVPVLARMAAKRRGRVAPAPYGK